LINDRSNREWWKKSDNDRLKLSLSSFGNMFLILIRKGANNQIAADNKSIADSFADHFKSVFIIYCPTFALSHSSLISSPQLLFLSWKLAK
jgi:hypothetical protein